MRRYAIFLAILAVLSLPACSSGDETLPPPSGFYVDQYEVLLTDTHGFERERQETVDLKELFLLKRDDSYIWLTRLDGILLSRTAQDKMSEIWVLGQQRIYNSSYLKGTRITPAKYDRVPNPSRPYIEQVLIVERVGEYMELMTELDLHLYAKEIERFPLGKRMMLANYYTLAGDSVYSLSLAAPPGDFLFLQDDAKKIFLDLQFNVKTRPQGY